MNINNNNKSNKIKNININGWNTATNLNYNNSSTSLMSPINSKPQVEGLIRNKIFHNFLKKKEEHHTETLFKQNYKNNLILDIEYPTSPGPNIPFSVFKILYLGELLPKLSAVVKKFVCLGIIS